MGLFTGAAPPDVTKTQTTASTTPDYYTDYLTKLSQTGQNAMGTFDPVTKQFTAPTQASMVAAGSPYVAELTQEQKDSISRANLMKANQVKKSSRSSSRMDYSMEVDSG